MKLNVNETVFIWCILLESVFNIPLKTTTTPTSNMPTTTSKPTQQHSCFQEGFPVSEADVIDEGYSPSTNTCWQIKCGVNGRLVKSITPCLNLEINTDQPLPTGQVTPEDGDIKCIFNGVTYKPGEEIQSLSDWQSDRCYGTRCSKFGEIVAWENFNCYSTPYYSTTTDESIQTTPFEAPSPTKTSPVTPTLECQDNSVIYRPGEEISYEYFSENKTCCGKYCNYNGKIVAWNDFNCAKLHTTLSTPVTESMTKDSSEGCRLNGISYEPETKIDAGNDGERWCFGRYCDENSRVVYWDDFNCDVTTQKIKTTIPALSEMYDSTTETTTNFETPTNSEIPTSSEIPTGGQHSSETTIFKPSTIENTESSSTAGGNKKLEQLNASVRGKLFSTVLLRKNGKRKASVRRLFENWG